MRILFLSFLIFVSFLFPSSSFASQVVLRPCIELSHCVSEEWEVSNIENPFDEIKSIIEKTSRTEIIEINGDYLHAEATSKWLKYVDDIEVSYLADTDKLLIRSESRVGESDLGVNQKRINLIKSKMFKFL